MLKQRVLTAIVLVPPLVAALFWLPSLGVAVLFGAFIAAAAWEWGTLSRLAGGARAAYVAVVLLVGAGLLWLSAHSLAAAQVVFAVAILWWLLALSQLGASRGVFHWPPGRLIAGMLTLVPAWVAVTLLHRIDVAAPALLLFLLVLVATADTAAYAAGHAFGRTRLAPKVSPGKTVEGVAGGAAAVVLLAYICGTMFWHFAPKVLTAWVALALIVGLVSVVGDLSESKLKRVAGVKDSSGLLPGHGGVLDRIDALTAAAPVFAWGWLLFFDASS